MYAQAYVSENSIEDVLYKFTFDWFISIP